MNERDLVNLLYKEHRLPRAFAKDILKSMLRAIGQALKKGDRVRLRNFGTFEVRQSHGKRRPKFDASKNMLKVYGRK